MGGKYGLTCDNLISADIVTANGDLLHVNAAEHSDLFWGLRGGGGNFGVVTSFEYQLHEVGPLLAGVVAVNAQLRGYVFIFVLIITLIRSFLG